MDNYILGIWDNHDAGVALVRRDTISFAVNEERLTRRKLEVCFPALSIRAALTREGLGPGDIAAVAVSTSDVAKTAHRLWPGLKEEYYLLRRRKKWPAWLDRYKKLSKYWMTEMGGNSITRWLSRLAIRRSLKPFGLDRHEIGFVDHHLCHAAAAALTSGFDSALVITLDGLGDGLSGSISVFQDGKLARLNSLSSRHSLGIFFEHVTNLMNMRELEDEGKVMALANYAYPIPDNENPLLSLQSEP